MRLLFVAIDFTIEYQKTSIESPFLASSGKALCNRLERAKVKVTQDVATLTTRRERLPTEDRKLSSYPTDWSNANLPPCSNACDHPTICIDTGDDCQCVLSSCPSLQRFPFSSFANLPLLSSPPPAKDTKTSEASGSPLVDMVERTSWRSVFRPQASRFVGFNVSFPRIYVTPLSREVEEHVDNWKDREGRKHDIGALRDNHCLSADAQLERAVRRMGVGPPLDGGEKGAEMVFIPHYQGRWNVRFLVSFLGSY